MDDPVQRAPSRLRRTLACVLSMNRRVPTSALLATDSPEGAGANGSPENGNSTKGCNATVSPSSGERTGWKLIAGLIFALEALVGSAFAQETHPQPADFHTPATSSSSLISDPASLSDLSESPSSLLTSWTSPEGLGSAVKMLLTLGVLSLAPAVLLMTTSFVRIVVVLGLLRQALGTQQLPPTQVMTSIALFLTLLVMAPTWRQVYDDAIEPYSNRKITLEEAWNAGAAPVRRFMADQIRRTRNDEDVYLLLRYMPEEREAANGSTGRYVYYGAGEGEREVPLRALVPAFMLSELKTAFLIGFQIFLPFVILDIVVASVTMSMGMVMLPPALISLPFKLLLFVMVDGWHLVVQMLLDSFSILT